jgi:transposase
MAPIGSSRLRLTFAGSPAGFSLPTKPRKIDLYDVFCGLLYLVKSGCQWRMIPADFPKWNTIYFYYGIRGEKKGNAQSVLEKVLKKIGIDAAQSGITKG